MVSGIGGIFVMEMDRVALRAWFQIDLVIDVQPWGCAAFTWADEAGIAVKCTTICNIGEYACDYYSPIEGVFTGDQKQEIVRKLTDTMVSIEGENMRGVTWVVVEEVKSGDWGMGGQPLTTSDVKALAAGGR